MTTAAHHPDSPPSGPAPHAAAPDRPFRTPTARVRPRSGRPPGRCRPRPGRRRTAPPADLDLAVELVYGPLYYRWQYRLGPLTHEHADRLVDAALRALNPPAASGRSDV
ncbi:TetR/AcrR family transcriptional regulator C-terminal ligand-binding domain-containing protein [Kitasatospora sp. NPDC004669]|uniref:TetR/AcrR family transcriptional regulator C-terminal ligand-binding domain-containing protein n=1 Tax=Kitasatospora sp. NPDC004669 TaxID=3154555 RepID=UPI0033A6F589